MSFIISELASLPYFSELELNCLNSEIDSLQVDESAIFYTLNQDCEDWSGFLQVMYYVSYKIKQLTPESNIFVGFGMSPESHTPSAKAAYVWSIVLADLLVDLKQNWELGEILGDSLPEFRDAMEKIVDELPKPIKKAVLEGQDLAITPSNSKSDYESSFEAVFSVIVLIAVVVVAGIFGHAKYVQQPPSSDPGKNLQEQNLQIQKKSAGQKSPIPGR